MFRQHLFYHMYYYVLSKIFNWRHLFLSLIKHHTVMKYGQWGVASQALNLGTWQRLSVSSTFRPIHPRGSRPWYPLYWMGRKLVWTGRRRIKPLPLSWTEPRLPNFLSITIYTELSQLIYHLLLWQIRKWVLHKETVDRPPQCFVVICSCSSYNNVIASTSYIDNYLIKSGIPGMQYVDHHNVSWRRTFTSQCSSKKKKKTQHYGRAGPHRTADNKQLLLWHCQYMRVRHK
jgi:hypothetical protein